MYNLSSGSVGFLLNKIFCSLRSLWTMPENRFIKQRTLVFIMKHILRSVCNETCINDCNKINSSDTIEPIKQIYNETWTDLQWNMNRFTMKHEQIYNETWTDLQWNMNRFTMKHEQIYNETWTDLQWNMNRFTMKHEQIYNETWTDLQWNMNRFTMKHEQIYNETRTKGTM